MNFSSGRGVFVTATGPARWGRTKRVTRAAVRTPASEYRPSWARPGKPENSRAPKPQSDVATPRRIVGQKRWRQPFRPRRPDCMK